MKQHKKANVAAKLAARPVKYNLMVGYDPILETEVSLVLQKNHLETKITTETYFYMNRTLTKPYKYPGDGTEDYTVYVTNTAG